MVYIFCFVKIERSGGSLSHANRDQTGAKHTPFQGVGRACGARYTGATRGNPSNGKRVPYDFCQNKWEASKIDCTQNVFFIVGDRPYSCGRILCQHRFDDRIIYLPRKRRCNFSYGKVDHPLGLLHICTQRERERERERVSEREREKELN